MHRMKFRWMVGIASVASLVIATRVTPASGEVRVMAHAVHTATHVQHTALHRRHHRRLVRQSPLNAMLVAQRRTAVPIPPPSRGERRPPHQRAALPSYGKPLRQHAGFKAGNRQAMVASALGVPLSTIMTRLDERQNGDVSQPEDCLNSGRGPPHVDIVPHSPPDLLAWRGRTLEPASTPSVTDRRYPFAPEATRPLTGGHSSLLSLANPLGWVANPGAALWAAPAPAASRAQRRVIDCPLVEVFS